MTAPAMAYKSSKYYEEITSNALHRSATFSTFTNSHQGKHSSRTTAKAESSEDGDAEHDFIQTQSTNVMSLNNKDVRWSSELVHDEDYSNIVWCGPGNRIPLLLFTPDCVMRKDPFARMAGERYHLTFKIVRTECKLVRTILQTFGFHETHANSPDFNLMWTGSHLKPYVLRGMTEFQKVNHFPRSYEITRKDRMFKNIQRLQQIKGSKYFDFVPTTYVLPGEYQDFCSAFLKDKGPYIVKPVASSRGRGIFLCNQPDSIPLDENYVVTKYISNPYLIDGFKFDLRIYVAVTSFDPLVIYMYEEGLARFATVKYQMHMRNLKNQCMHLTNYSVNKRSTDFVQNDDADVEDFGNKWSLGALLRYLQAEGVDTASLIMRIEDVVIKALISVEMTIGTACKMFQPYRGNCYELFGFDIILDEHLRPWLLEVNLSPSLACDSPLDFKVKTNMVSDLFSLTGVVCYDPILKTSATHKNAKKNGSSEVFMKTKANTKPRVSSINFSPTKQRPNSANNSNNTGANLANFVSPMGMDEARMVRWIKEEYLRRGGWIRLYPAKHTWEQYSALLQSATTNNLLLHQKLFPEMWPATSMASAASAPVTQKGKVPLHSLSSSALSLSLDPNNDHYGRIHAAYETAQEHLRFFCRKLGQKPISAREYKTKRTSSPNFHQNRDPENHLLKQISLSSSHLSLCYPDCEPPLRTTNPVNNIFRGNLVKPVIIEESKELDDLKKPVHASLELAALNSNFSDNLSEANNSSVCNTEPEDSEMNMEAPLSSTAMDSLKEMDLPLSRKKQQPSLQALIAEGGEMNRFQARTAFSAYLNRVQKRFITESRLLHDDDLEEVKASEEQMDLVLRFLRHASSHLSQSLKVAAPSKRLSLPQRKRILAQTLSLFVRHYDKETDTLRQKVGSVNQKGMDLEAFRRIIHEGTENDLELFLTIYTQKHKSAGIFIDSSTVNHPKVSISSLESPSLLRENTISVQNPTNTAKLMPSASEHLRQIALIYGKSLNESPFGKRRPLSANLPYRNTNGNYQDVTSVNNNANNKALAPSRPPSGTFRTKPLNQSAQVETYDEDAINLALQRMALKQQARQYTADKMPATLSLKSLKARPHSAERRLDYRDCENKSERFFISRPHETSGQFYEDCSDVRRMDDIVVKNRTSTAPSPQLMEQLRFSKQQLLDPSLSREASSVINPRPPHGPKPPSLIKKTTGGSYLSRAVNISSSNLSSLTSVVNSSRRSNTTATLQHDPFWS